MEKQIGFSKDEMLTALSKIEEHQVDPFMCPRCGNEAYVVCPEGWTPGTRLLIDCRCGTPFGVIGGTKCGGVILGKAR